MTQPLLRIVNIVVGDGGMRGDTIVPQCDSPFLPSNSRLQVLALRDVLHSCQHTYAARCSRRQLD